LALSLSEQKIFVEGVAKVDEPYRHVSTYVDQTNILLGETASIQAIPRLEVATDDIVGGHSCRVHRLSGETLFYLTSRGLLSNHAEAMLLNSEILRHLDIFEEEKEKKSFCLEMHKKLHK
jgi:Fe-S cluster assembly scaffold protein SufB